MNWHVFTDGSCQHGVANVPKRTPGWGGWCAIVEHGSDGVVLRGRAERTTNVRMELVAAIEGLRAVPSREKAVLHTDCTTLLCVRDAARERRLATHTGADAALWRDFAAELAAREVRIHLIVKGERDDVHRRAHVIAGAEARAGLRDLPVNAAPLDELGGEHRIREGMRRQARRRAKAAAAERRPHLRGCEPGFCLDECPVRVRFGAVGDLTLKRADTSPRPRS